MPRVALVARHVDNAIEYAGNKQELPAVCCQAADSACCEPPPAELREGVALFNAGEYFTCHEVLEELWRAELRPVRGLYQGILQIGVAFHHLQRGNWIGAVRLLERGLARVEPFQPCCQGVDTARLVAQARVCLEQLITLGPERSGAFPWRLVPTIVIHEHVDAEHGRNR